MMKVFWMFEIPRWFYNLRYYVVNGELVKVIVIKDGMLRNSL